MQRTILAGLIVTGALVAAIAAPSPNQPQNQPQNPQQNQPQAGDIGAMLIHGLKNTKGCLGVETAGTAGGKDLIMAWFEDAEAARRWYHSPVHMRMVGMFGAEPKEKALEHVADDTPVLVIASLTMSDDQQRIAGSPVPISQIAIELYTPLPGGAFVNGRLAPDTLRVDHMIDHTPPATTPAAEPPAEPNVDTEPAEVVPVDA